MYLHLVKAQNASAKNVTHTSGCKFVYYAVVLNL